MVLPIYQATDATTSRYLTSPPDIDTESRGALGDQLPVHSHAAQHLVLDLNEVAGIEEVGAVEQRIGDVLGMRMEAAMMTQRLELRVGG